MCDHRGVDLDGDEAPLRARVIKRQADRVSVQMELSASSAAGTENHDSDIDFLVEFEPGSSLFDLMDLQEALQQLLGVSVDVVSVGGLKERDEHIRREAVPI